jgi:hypothetical protein
MQGGSVWFVCPGQTEATRPDGMGKKVCGLACFGGEGSPGSKHEVEEKDRDER